MPTIVPWLNTTTLLTPRPPYLFAGGHFLDPIILSSFSKPCSPNPAIFIQGKRATLKDCITTCNGEAIVGIKRQLQMQVHGARLIALATYIMIVKQGGILALYAGHLPSILQAHQSVAISYFVYELMEIVLKAE